jgi:hypothetical protein
MGELRGSQSDYKSVVQVVQQISRLLERLGLSPEDMGKVLELVQKATNRAYVYGARSKEQREGIDDDKTSVSWIILTVTPLCYHPSYELEPRRHHLTEQLPFGTTNYWWRTGNDGWRKIPVSLGLGGITFQQSCPYRGRKDMDNPEAPNWLCTIRPGKECSAETCSLEAYPFKDSYVEGSEKMDQGNWINFLPLAFPPLLLELSWPTIYIYITIHYFSFRA